MEWSKQSLIPLWLHSLHSSYIDRFKIFGVMTNDKMNRSYEKLRVMMLISIFGSLAAVLGVALMLPQQSANGSLADKNNQLDNRSITSGNNDDSGPPDIISRIKITVVNRTSGVDKVLTPIYQLTQTTLTGEPDWRIFQYILRDSPQNLDVKAIMGIRSTNNGRYDIEIGKLTQQSIRIDIDNGNRTLTLPPTKWNKVGIGFVEFQVQGNAINTINTTGTHIIPYLP
jgi:hypothetical protein